MLTSNTELSTRIFNLIKGGVTPVPHKTTHENGGADEISVTGLSGLLATPQRTAATPGSYTNANITIDANGVITIVSNGTGGSVTSVFGRTGVVVSTSGDYTTAQVTEVTNLYFTVARVLATALTGLSISGGSIASTDTIIEGFGKLQNQINGILGGAIYQGVWNANTNSPTLTGSSGTKGYYYVVNVAGSTNLDGITDWKVGDWAIFNGATWDKVDNTDAVSSVNGLIGAVALTGTTNRLTISAANVFDISATFEALLGKVANPLSQFAATTSAQLASIMSDETGTNKLVFSDSPVLTTPDLGTPSALVLTNATGLPVAGGGTGATTALQARINLGTADVIKSADQTTAAGADTAITELTFATAAGESWSFEIQLIGQVSGAGGAGFTIAYSVAPNSSSMLYDSNTTGIGARNTIISLLTTPLITSTMWSVATTELMSKISGSFTNGASANTVTIKVKPINGAQTVTIRKNSYLTARKVS